MPVRLNGVALPLYELVINLDTLAAAHGIGHVSAGTLHGYAPASLVLHAAHRALAQAAYGDALVREAAEATVAWTRLVEQGGWFSPERATLDAFFAGAQQCVHGSVRLRFSRGTFDILSTESAPAPAIVPVRAVPTSAQH